MLNDYSMLQKYIKNFIKEWGNILQRIVRCSKLKISSDLVGIVKSSILLLLAMILFLKEIETIIAYSIVTFIILIFIHDIFNLSKNVDIEVDMYSLLNDYKKSEYKSDEKYEYKYIKLKGIVSNIKFDKKENILTIELKSNDTYKLKGVAFYITKKCFKYIENISEGKEVTIYGDFKREENQMYIGMRYLK